jgi:hypothetical protein
VHELEGLEQHDGIHPHHPLVQQLSPTLVALHLLRQVALLLRYIGYKIAWMEEDNRYIRISVWGRKKEREGGGGSTRQSSRTAAVVEGRGARGG